MNRPRSLETQRRLLNLFFCYSLDLCIALCKCCASLWLRIDTTPSKNYNYEVLLTRALARINGLTVSFDTFYLYDRKRFAAHALQLWTVIRQLPPRFGSF